MRRPPKPPSSKRAPDRGGVRSVERIERSVERIERSADKELKVAGRNACRAVFERRRDDIRRVYVTERTLKPFSDVLRWCAQQRIAYHIKDDLDLDTIADTPHHDGVCFIARAKSPVSFDAVVRNLAAKTNAPSTVVLIEDIKNPHNLGAILRVCAHFGVAAVVAVGDTPALSPASMRTAEGGAEWCDVANVDAAAAVAAVRKLKAAGLRVIATSSHAQKNVDVAEMPKRALVMFGSEAAGLSQRLLAEADVTVAIPGSGQLESLNVACASSVVLWELWKRGSRS